MKTYSAFTRFVSCGVGILLALLILSSNMKAQSNPCPSSMPDNSGTGWTSGGCFPDFLLNDGSGSYCRYTVCFCYRYVSSTSTFDYVISSITKNDNTCGQIITNVNVGGLVSQAMTKLLYVDPVFNIYKGYIPACGSGLFLERRAVKASCWEVDPPDPATGTGGTAFPCAGTGWCIEGSYWCMYQGYPQSSDIIYKSKIEGTCNCNVITCD